MGKITQDMLAKCPSHTKRSRDETLQHYLRRLTHLYFAEKNIDSIDNLSMCRNLSVLYLYDNNISRIKNLGFAVNLTHLYLQKNRIAKIEGLENMRRLSKLYLGNNSITVVEGLEKLESLRELHIEKQQLPPGEKLLFEPRALQALSRCLCVLNISDNNIDSIDELRCLEHTTQFFTENNHLSDMKELSRVLACWPSLWRLELTGNPLCSKKKYRDRVIVMATSLVMLDSKEINETSKRFLINWKASKDAARRKQKRQQELYMEDPTSANSLTSVPMLPAIQGPPRAGMGYIVNSGMNPLLRGADAPELAHAITIPRGAQHFATVMQARMPNSTLLNRKPAEDVSKSRFPNIFAPPRPLMPDATSESERHSGGAPVSLQT